MKILLAIDGSPCSNAALQDVVGRPWPSDTEVRVFSVIHAMPFVPEPTMMLIGLHYYSLDQEQKRAAHAVAAAAREFAAHAPHLRVTSGTAEGSPAAQIVDEARRWGAELIVIGSHGHGVVARMVLGSVSHAVMLHAHCSVEVVRERTQPSEYPQGPGTS